MIKTRLILAVAFVLVFAAGGSLGLVLARKPAPPERGPGSWLTQELNLSAEQREQMKKIWSEAMGEGFRRDSEQRRSFSQQRDQQIRDLMTSEQQAKYDAIQQEYAKHLEELSQQRKARFEEAVARTKKILTPQQVVKYEEMLKQREHGPGGPGGFRPRHRPTRPSSSRPSTEPATPRVEE
ncbi:MAG: hypothetical protein BWX88_03051 [Planctomycetes bacterium ADurb.Bin126]|nr:MAG: hypothetical protein BWX88_03051 [Planctomycetes bacterium ADurb.Bin126]HOD81782.1 hypothetical protein [Phycisphaerae bacterium]HQL75574.1 hypothetical protein [Phycisphaerae bacterium]